MSLDPDPALSVRAQGFFVFSPLVHAARMDSSDSSETPQKTEKTDNVGPLVRQAHGGALRPSGGRQARLSNPTDADVADRARKQLYSVIPKLTRIANNTPKRPRGQANDPNAKPKRPYSVGSQIKAISELRMLALLDRTLREARVNAAVAATRDEILGRLPVDQAQALIAAIAPHWRDV